VARPEAAAAPADLAVGLVTYNHARTADAIGRAVRDAVSQFPAASGHRILVADAGSTDSTLDRLRGAAGAAGELIEVPFAAHAGDVLDLPYHGLPGRARALRAILREAASRGSRACVVLDPSTAASGPEAVAALCRAAIESDADLVIARYSRHPFSGALIHGVLYPMFRALYGSRIRYPVAGDFICSARLVEATLTDPIWDTERGQVGIDLWLAATAASAGYRMAQVPIEVVVKEERDGPDLSTTIRQILGFLFTDMERRVAAWQRVRGSRGVPPLAEPSAPAGAVPDLNVAQLVDSFRLGWRELQDVWAEVLPPLAILQWRRLSAAPIDAFRVEDALWARTVYDFAMGHRLRVIARDHLLQSLAPLYLAWLASFASELRHAPSAIAEERIERLCHAFEAEKPYLISLWRWPERFRPAKLRR
jgi:hypothetical protein